MLREDVKEKEETRNVWRGSALRLGEARRCFGVQVKGWRQMQLVSASCASPVTSKVVAQGGVM